MIKYKYFFGSDSRSVQFLSILNNEYSSLVVVTLPPIKKGRGRKLTVNPVEEYCDKNNINFHYYEEDKYYDDMEFGIVASFAKIFTFEFLDRNAPLFNIHLSLLPKYRGPTPVETAVLNCDTETGYTVFNIDKDIDTGNIIFQNTINIQGKYASEVYEMIYNLFKEDILSIDFNSPGYKQPSSKSSTSKYYKDDFNITKSYLKEAKNKIKAFNLLGPAYVEFNNKIIKIHSYSDEESESRIKLLDGFIYPLQVTPEGKRVMSFKDYLRGLK